MFDCKKTLHLLPEYTQQDLNPLERKCVENHLALCPSCREEYATEQLIIESLGDLPLLKCPDLVTKNILVQIETQAETQDRENVRPWFWDASSLVAAGLALVFFAHLFFPAISSDSYSRQEIQSATVEAQWALAKVAAVIDRQQKSSFEQVFGQEIPTAVGGSLRLLTKNLQGDV